MRIIGVVVGHNLSIHAWNNFLTARENSAKVAYADDLTVTLYNIYSV